MSMSQERADSQLCILTCRKTEKSRLPLPHPAGAFGAHISTVWQKRLHRFCSEQCATALPTPWPSNYHRLFRRIETRAKLHAVCKSDLLAARHAVNNSVSWSQEGQFFESVWGLDETDAPLWKATLSGLATAFAVAERDTCGAFERSGVKPC